MAVAQVEESCIELRFRGIDVGSPGIDGCLMNCDLTGRIGLVLGVFRLLLKELGFSLLDDLRRRRCCESARLDRLVVRARTRHILVIVGQGNFSLVDQFFVAHQIGLGFPVGRLSLALFRDIAVEVALSAGHCCLRIGHLLRVRIHNGSVGRLRDGYIGAFCSRLSDGLFIVRAGLSD